MRPGLPGRNRMVSLVLGRLFILHNHLIVIDTTSSHCQTIYGAGKRQLGARTQYSSFFIAPFNIDRWMPDIRRITYVPRPLRRRERIVWTILTHWYISPSLSLKLAHMRIEGEMHHTNRIWIKGATPLARDWISPLLVRRMVLLPLTYVSLNTSSLIWLEYYRDTHLWRTRNEWRSNLSWTKD